MPQVRWKENQLATCSMYIFLLRMGSEGLENREQREKHFEDKGGVLKYSSLYEPTSGLDTHGAHVSLARMYLQS